MTRGKWLVAGLAVTLLVAAPVLAAEEGRPAKVRKAKRQREPKAPRSVIRGEYARLVEWCGCTAKQKARLEQRITEKRDKMKAWSQAHADQLKAAREKMAEARKIEDKQVRREAMKAAKEEAKPLMDARAALSKECDEAILAVLTPRQRDAWAGHDLYRRVARRLRKLELSEPQKDQIRDLAIAAAKDMDAAEDRKAKSAVQKKFHAEVMENVLTAEQRARMETARKERRVKEPKENRPRERKKAKKGKGVAAVEPDQAAPAGS